MRSDCLTAAELEARLAELPYPTTAPREHVYGVRCGDGVATFTVANRHSAEAADGARYIKSHVQLRGGRASC